jgi:uncharacterized protein YyaL (SSP411 family)
MSARLAALEIFRPTRYMSVNVLKNSVMKKLALIAFAALATSAFAADPAINISGYSTQTTTLNTSAALNAATGTGAKAVQSLASNVGYVDIGGNSTQTVTANSAVVANVALGANAVATQNLASNTGDVNIFGGNSTQTVTLNTALVANAAGANATAVQNISSNNAN